LGEIRQRGGKRVIAFCGETAFDPAALSSNMFEMEWPPKGSARSKILSGQVELLNRLMAAVGS
jgi:predicted NUDIX family NTP pyrophosphohydrolase